MNRRFSLLLAVAVASAAAGCHKEPPAPLADDKVPETLGNAFKGADAATKAAVDAAVTAVKDDERGQALVALEKLSLDPNLTPEQREAVSRASMGARKKIRDAAAAGDKAAEEFLRQQAAGK